MDRAGEKERITLLSRNPIKTEKRTPQAKSACGVSFIMIIYLLYKNSCLYETDRRLLAAMRTAVREVAMQKQVEKKKYYVVRERAVPEVLLKVVEAKRLLESKRVATVQEAAERTGISRSSFYKYKDDIFPFHEETKGKTITFIIQMDDEPGLLSMVLQTIARFHGNILTIHQSIPINGVATLTLSVDILPGEGDAEAMVEDIEQRDGIHYLKILGRE